MILDAHGRQVRETPNNRTLANPVSVRVRARYDAAQSVGPHANHWTSADFLAPDAAANPSVRKTLRSRCRYEIANNSYAAGIVSTLAHYVIGTGPTLRLIPRPKTGKRGEGALLVLSKAFNDWAWEIGLARALNSMQRSKTGDGEAFSLLTTRPKIGADRVSLSVRTFEADLCQRANETANFDNDQPEGIDIDSDGQPKAYHILKRHPGSGYFAVVASDASIVPAPMVCHWFDESRPGLHRGIPEITPALPMFAQLRRYTQAVVVAAEAAADFAAVLHTDAPPGEDSDGLAAGTTFALEKGVATSLPVGWDIGQVKAEHPGPQHAEFLRCIIRELGRCVDMPLAVAAMDSSGHNFSSMRGDWQAFFQGIRWRRYLCEQQVLEKILHAWLDEARLVFGIAIPTDYEYVWDWPDFVPVDPVKEATAAEIRLRCHLTTRAREYATRGLNWEDELRQERVEKEARQGLDDESKPLPAPPIPDDAEDPE